MLLSFLDELEKYAGAETLLKVLKNADLVAGSKGIRAGLKVLEQHKGPMFALPKGALKKTVDVKTYDKGVGGLEKFFLSELGNTAHALNRVSEGVGKGNSLLTNAKTLGKNFGTLLGDQIRGARYKVLDASKVTTDVTGMATPKRKLTSFWRKPKPLEPSYVKGKGLFKNKIYNRKIEGKTSGGDYIVKKRKAAVPFAMALTPVGFGAGTFILGSGKKNESLGSRTSAAVKETALWSLAPPVAQAKLISDMLK